MGNLFSSSPADDRKCDTRWAMESGAFCVICGSPFDIEGDLRHVDHKDPRFKWLLNFRLLGCVSDVEASKVASGDAIATNESTVDDIFLSERAWFRTSGSQYFQVPSQDGIGDIWFDTPSYAENAETLFPLHEACISISCKVIEYSQSTLFLTRPKPALAVLNQLLKTRVKDRHDRLDVPEDTSNDLFDLCERSDEYGPRSVMAITKLEMWGGEYDKFYAYPLDETNTSRFVLEVLQALPRAKVEYDQKWIPSRSSNIVGRLPSELLDLICSFLPSRSVIALHRTSKTLAWKIPLDNMLWRNSLRDGSLHPYLWDLDTNWIEHHQRQSCRNSSDTSSNFDWEGVAQLLSAKRVSITNCNPGLIDVPDHLWNRCRIWCIIQDALVMGQRHDGEVKI